MDNESKTAQANAWLAAWAAETNNAHVVGHLTELLSQNLKTNEAAAYCEQKLYAPVVGTLYTEFLYWVADRQKKAKEDAAQAAMQNNDQFVSSKNASDQTDATDPLTRLGDLLYQQSELSAKISTTIFELAESIKRGQ